MCHYILQDVRLIGLASVQKVCCKYRCYKYDECDNQGDLCDPQGKSFSCSQLFFNDSCLANILRFSLEIDQLDETTPFKQLDFNSEDKKEDLSAPCQAEKEYVAILWLLLGLPVQDDLGQGEEKVD